MIEFHRVCGGSMNNLRGKIIVGIVVFSILSSAFIAIINYIKLRDQTIEENRLIFHRIEGTIKNSIETFEKAMGLLDYNTASEMHNYSLRLIEKYKKNPNFDEWDFEELYKEIGMHIYIIDQDNVITHSSFPEDIGLDFDECCKKLAYLLDYRRDSGEFFHEAMDIEQKTGELKKYSYMATPDKKYLIELGYSLNENIVFDTFNFFQTIDELKKLYPYIYDIHILNIGGLTFGKSASDRKLTMEQRKAFEAALASKETKEIEGEWKGKPATYRYVYYDSAYDEDFAENKVIEIIYDKNVWSENLGQYKKMFLIQLFIILSFVLVLSFAIARPMYLAYHDRLTGLSNRSAFDELLSTVKAKNGKKTAFFMIDLDHFKEVNDIRGHHKGDALLKQVAHIIHRTISRKGVAYRYGGDEFVVVVNSTTPEEAKELAQSIIEKINEFVRKNEDIYNLGVSASIGISFYPDDGDDKNLLCKKADAALYMAKKKGRGQYSIFQSEQS